MRRDYTSLLKERTEGEVDARKRRRLESERSEEDRAERVERAAEARVQAMQRWINKWDAFHAQSASEYHLVPPAPNPLGATYSCFSSSPLTLLSSSPSRLITLPFPGATLNPLHIRRYCSRLDCMKAFLSVESVEQIAERVEFAPPKDQTRRPSIQLPPPPCRP